MDAHQIRSIIESTRVVVWEAELPQLLLSYVSPYAERLFGYPLAAWYEPNFWVNALHEGDRDWAVTFCRTQTERNAEHELTYRMHAADGSIRWVRDIVTVSQPEEARTVLRGVFIDVTEEKRREARRMAVLDETTVAGEHVSAQLASLADGLRPAIAALLAESDRLRTAPPADAQGLSATTAAIAELAQRIESAVDDAVSATGTPVRPILSRPSEFDPGKVIDVALRAVEPRAAARGLALDATIAESAQRVVRGERGVVERVLDGVLANAVRHADSGRIALLAQIESGELRLRLTDNTVPPDDASGAGLAAPDTLRRIGLSGIERLVLDAGGTMRVVRHRQIGTRLEIALPVIPVAGASERDPSGARKARRRALYIEDEHTNAAAMTELLRLMGVETVIAPDGETALAMFESESFDIVLIDLRMPGIGGLVTASRLREIEAGAGRARIPMIAVTAHSQREDIRACLKAGLDAHLAKPIRFETLSALVERHLGTPGSAPVD